MSVDDERALIGAILFKPKRYETAAEIIEPEDFEDEFLAGVFTTMFLLNGARKAIGVASLLEYCEGDKEKAAEYLDACVQLSGIGDSVDRLARSVRDAAIKRRLAGVAKWAEAAAADIDQTPETLLGEIENRLVGAVGERHAAHAVELLGAGDKAWLEGAADPNRYAKGLRSGFSDLDRVIGGLNPGALIVLAGRPSMGKSALAVSLMRGAVMQNGCGGHIYSGEMVRRELWGRMVSEIARETERVPYSQIGKCALLPDELQAVKMAADVVRDMPIRVDFRPARTAEQVAASARRSAAYFRAKGTPLGLIVVDYLQIMQIDRSYSSNLSFAIGRISSAMKALAVELQCAVVLMSQLNRDVEKRDSRRPYMSDLRQSGEIEQDADVVGLILRPEYYTDRDKGASDEQRAEARNKLRLFIDKNRQGPVEEVELYCDIACNAVRDKNYDFTSGGIFRRAA